MSRRGSNDCLTPRPNTLKAHPMKAHVAPCCSPLFSAPSVCSAPTFAVPVEKYLGRYNTVRVYTRLHAFSLTIPVRNRRRKVIVVRIDSKPRATFA